MSGQVKDGCDALVNTRAVTQISCGVNRLVADLASPDKSSTGRVFPRLFRRERRLAA